MVLFVIKRVLLVANKKTVKHSKTVDACMKEVMNECKCVEKMKSSPALSICSGIETAKGDGTIQHAIRICINPKNEETLVLRMNRYEANDLAWVIDKTLSRLDAIVKKGI
jgi:hypothetical protein